jgi:hypothetical protein
MGAGGHPATNSSDGHERGKGSVWCICGSRYRRRDGIGTSKEGVERLRELDRATGEWLIHRPWQASGSSSRMASPPV